MRVLVFGASSTQGYWDTLGGWADRLKNYYNAILMRDFSKDIPKVMNLGISDDTTTHILERLEPEAAARQNAKGLSFVIQVGSNNAAELNGKPRSTTAAYQADLEKIIIKARKYSDKILIVGFPAVDEARTNPIAWANMNFKNADISRYEDAAKKTAEKAEVPFVPVHGEFLKKAAGGEDLHAHDGLHPNDAGHRLIFELVRPALDELLNT
jgi:lysophospholipase L1-like esterase